MFEDFTTGPDCTDPINVVEVVSHAFGKYQEVEWLTARDMVGMNATVGVRIVLFGPNPLITDSIVDEENIEEIYQVCDVALTQVLKTSLADFEMRIVRIYNLHRRRPIQ